MQTRKWNEKVEGKWKDIRICNEQHIHNLRKRKVRQTYSYDNVAHPPSLFCNPLFYFQYNSVRYKAGIFFTSNIIPYFSLPI